MPKHMIFSLRHASLSKEVIELTGGLHFSRLGQMQRCSRVTCLEPRSYIFKP